MKGKVLPWPLFIDTAKAPEHFTELTFSAAKRHRAEGRGLQKCCGQDKAQGSGREDTYAYPKSVPCMGSGSYRAPPLSSENK